MSWPASPVTTGELVTAAQMNMLPVRLAETVLGASAASIDVTSIPAIYSHLSFVITGRSASAAAEGLLIRMNGDTAGNYFYQSMYAKSTVYLAAEGLAQTSMQVGTVPGTGAPSSAYFSACEIWLPHYANTTTHKALIAAWCHRASTATQNTYAGQSAGTWANTAAINRITVLLSGGSSLAANSTFSLYGWA